MLRSLSSFLASFLTFVDETRTQVVVTYVTSTLLYTDTVGELRGGGFRPFTAKTLRVVVMSESRVPRGIENTQGAQNETKDEKSTHMPARVRQVFCDEFSAALVDGKAYVIPHDIDAGADMFTTAPPTVENLQCKLSAGDIACAEYEFLDVRGVVGGGVVVYNSGYFSKYEQER